MQAKSIQEALNLFDPQHPLIEGDDLKAYHISRDNSPIEEMKTFLTTATDFPKLLFTGPPGTGKSTELAKLREMVKDNFHIIFISSRDISSNFVVNVESLLFAIFNKIADKAKDEKLPIFENKLRQFILRGYGWETNVEQVTTAKGIGDKIGHDSALLEKYITKNGMEYEGTLKLVSKKTAKPGADEIIEHINSTVWDLEEKTKKDVLVIVTDLDDLERGSAKEMFTNLLLYLTKLNCFAVYSFPLALKHESGIITMLRNFSGIYYLPGFMVNSRWGIPNETDQKKLQEIIDKRIIKKLIYDDARSKVIQICGGNLTELMNIMRHCCLVALNEKIDFIDLDVVNEAEARIRRIFEIGYDEKYRKCLFELHKTKKFQRDDTSLTLLDQLAIMEYVDGEEVWHDVNPILLPLLANIDFGEE